MNFSRLSFVHFLFILVLCIWKMSSAHNEYLCPRTEKEFKIAELLHEGVEEACDEKCATEKAIWANVSQTEPRYVEAYDEYKECYSECETDIITSREANCSASLSQSVQSEGGEEEEECATSHWKEDPEIKAMEKKLQGECNEECKPSKKVMDAKQHVPLAHDVFFGCLYVCYAEKLKNPRNCHAVYLAMLHLGYSERALRG
uniref:Chondroitin proteoglycan 4 domain-containing protein n=1 Tax=Trichuris muris TaxID=70415 RepID=A0A5S6R2C8_TRIMR